MDVPKSDLVVGLIGVVVLVGLVVGLFFVNGGLGGSGSTATDETPGGGSAGGPDADDPAPYANDTFEGTLPAGAVLAGDESQQQSVSHSFDVPNETVEIVVTLEFSGGEGDLDCHLYDGNDTKLGDDECHRGTPDDPQGAEFNVSLAEYLPGEWEVVVHTGKTGDTNYNSEMDYTVRISQRIQGA